MEKTSFDFKAIEKRLTAHGKEPLKRTKSQSFTWGDSETCRDILKRGFEYCTGEVYKRTHEYDEIAKWMSDTEGKGLALIGSSGRGKTIFLHGILPFLLMKFQKVPTLRKAVAMNFEDCGKANILIDEAGREDEPFINGRGKIDLFPVHCDMCVDRNYPIYMTSNLTKELFIKRYGDYVFNRIKSSCTVVNCKGEEMWY